VLPSRRALLKLGVGALGLLAGCAPSPAPSPIMKPPTPQPGKAVPLWDRSGLKAQQLFQQEIDALPEGPHMLRVTELEMAPDSTIDPHTHLGPGVQVVLSGAFTVKDEQSGAEKVYATSQDTPFPVYYTGLNWRYSTANRAPQDNRLFMAEILPQSRGFLGNQKFDREGGTHNSGGIRSGPYVQVPLQALPEPPLMVRVTLIDMGPKAKTPEYTRPGPALFFVVSGQGTFRNQDKLGIQTTGAGGYYVEDGAEPSILENKPITPNRILAVEFLPASLGKQPSTVPTGREI
jgi:quercetin dioxygenase-like cupin family protein